MCLMFPSMECVHQGGCFPCVFISSNCLLSRPKNCGVRHDILSAPYCHSQIIIFPPCGRNRLLQHSPGLLLKDIFYCQWLWLMVTTLQNLPSPWVAWTSTEMAYLILCHPISLTYSPLTFSCTPPLPSTASIPSYALSSAGVILLLESGFFLPVLSPSTPSLCLPCGVAICLNTPSSHPLHDTLMVSPYPWCCD